MRGEFIDLSGRRLYYYAAGTRESGHTVVFVHGPLTSSHLWSSVVSLVPRQHRLVVIDLLGHGRSDPPGTDDDLSIAAHAGRLAALLDQLSVDRATLVAHGRSAEAGWRVAVTSARAHRLLLVAPVEAAARPPARERTLRAMRHVVRHLPAGLLTHWIAGGLREGYALPERGSHSLDQYLRPFASPAGRRVVLDQLRAIDASLRNAGFVLPGDSAAVPTALVWGSDDPFVSQEAVDRLHSAIRGSTLDVVNGGRHFLPEESPERIVSVLCDLLER